MEGVEVVAWLRTVAEWLLADNATLARVVGAFASARCGGSFSCVGFG